VLLPWADAPQMTVLAVDTIPQVVANITDLVTGFLAGLATLALTIGGARHLMSAGDPGEVSAAKRLYKEAALGYAIAVLAPTLVALLRGALGA
jgi:hypothetical protein